MPRKKDAKVIGHCPCQGCGKNAAVFQNVRGYLYLRCDDCGADQRNGKGPQTYMYTKSSWIGAAPKKPRNVPDYEPEQPEQTGAAQGVGAVEGVPEGKPEGEPIGGDFIPASEAEEVDKKANVKGLVAGSAFLAFVGVLLGAI